VKLLRGVSGRFDRPGSTAYLRSCAVVAALSVAAIVLTVPMTAEAKPTKRHVPMSWKPAWKAAQIKAHHTGKQVEVVSAETETSTTWANPNGTFSTQISSGPVRVKSGRGLVGVDTRLGLQGGELRPRAVAADVSFSDGGSGPFATLRKDGHVFALSWPSRLPRPRVSGDTATYRDVVPGGDLVVRALTSGFTHDVILRERPKGPLKLIIPVTLSGLKLTQRPSGRLELTDGKGKVVASAPQPRLWDKVADARPGTGHGAELSSSVRRDGQGTDLVLQPDARFLNDPGVTYPVTIDPTTTLGLTTDTFVSPDNPGPGAPTGWLQAGKYNGNTARTFLKFNTSSLIQASVTDAVLSLWNTSSSGCGASVSNGIEVRRLNQPWDPATLTNSNQPGETFLDAQTTTTGYGSNCPTGPGYMTWHIPGIVSNWVDGNQPNDGIRLADANEFFDYNNWRIFESSSATGTTLHPPTLTVTYQPAPSMPTSLTVTPTDANAPAGLPLATSTTPTIAATSADPNGRPLDYTFQIMGGFQSSLPVQQTTVKGVPSGLPATLTLGTQTNPGVFGYRVQATNGTTTSPWSQVAWAVVDAPGTPTSLGTNVADPSSPILSGVMTRPSGGSVTGQFFLYDSAGAAVGHSPLGVGTASGGNRISIQVPTNLIQPGASYSWTMQACVQSSCSAVTAPTTFTVPQAPPPIQGTASMILPSSAITVQTALSAAVACSSSPCPLASDTAVKVGGSGSGQQITLLKVDPSAIPSGARITSAILNLGTPTCTGGCPTTAQLTASQLQTGLVSGATGADAVAGSVSATITPAALSSGQVDLTGLVGYWQNEPTQNTGITLTSDSTSPASYNLAGANVQITYAPGTVPGAVRGLAARQGDGGALVTWAAPADPGAAAPPVPSGSDGSNNTPITGYDVQVLDNTAAVVKTVQSQTSATIITGLTDGTTYAVQVRADNAFGNGPWATAGQVTPTAVPGGVQQYLNLTTAYVKARESLIEGSSPDANTAASTFAGGAANAIAAMLAARQDYLLDTHSLATAMGAAQLSDTAQINASLVSYSATTGRVTVRADLGGTYVFADGVGTTLENHVSSDYTESGDFQFSVDSLTNAVTALGQLVGDALDPNMITGTINARTPEQAADTSGSLTTSQILAPPTVLSTAPMSKLMTAQAPALAGQAINHQTMANWARAHIRNTGWDYGEDCTNFMSKVMHYGGGAQTIGHWLYDIGDHSKWFTGPVHDSDTWYSAAANFDHFAYKRNRIGWHWSIGAIAVGDIMWWNDDNSGGDGGGVDHMSIVTYKNYNTHWGTYTNARGKTVSLPIGIYIADHGLGSSPTVGFNGYSPLWKAVHRDADVPKIGYASLNW
jgi:Putative amidase domain